MNTIIRQSDSGNTPGRNDLLDRKQAAYHAIYEFNSHWRKLRAKGFRGGDHSKFDALIQTQSKKTPFTGVVEVMIINSGFDDGIVNLIDRMQALPRNHHAQFNVRFQSMSFETTTHALVITGQSEQMGIYNVSILPADYSADFSDNDDD